MYLSPEPIDSLATYGVLNMDGEQMMTKYKLFTVVLVGQDFDFITNRPTAGDLIEIEINGIAETWYVTKGASASCWGFMHGNEKIWILTSKFDPRKQ